mmetsp:Transcript_23420/g.39152  ORF Transcript_23420/g.39152 Transcript_23420/m.39152 type:complete len:326 (-) Transcript_23420:140-1117(-)
MGSTTSRRLLLLALCSWYLSGLGLTYAGYGRRSLNAVNRNNAFIGYSERVSATEMLLRQATPLSLPHKACVDTSDFCKYWADMGECKANVIFMNRTCPAGCAFCKKAVVPPPTPLTPQTGHEPYRGFWGKDVPMKVVLGTSAGDIEVRMRTDASPATVEAVLKLAVRNGDTSACARCRLYRNEAAPPHRPDYRGEGPYGLVQGSFGSDFTTGLAPEFRGIPVDRGAVCLIPGTADFFISVTDHPEWTDSFIVWGRVEDMTTVDAITRLPFTEQRHPKYRTLMRMLVKDLPIGLRLRPETASEQARRWRGDWSRGFLHPTADHDEQ